jgi:hypothetical protein
VLRNDEVKIEDGDVRVDLNARALATIRSCCDRTAPPSRAGPLTTDNKGKGQLRLEDVVPTNTAPGPPAMSS